MTDPLRTWLAAADGPDPVIDAAERARQPPGAWDPLDRLGVLAETGRAESAACDGCGLDHVEPVTWVEAPGRLARAFIACPEAGRVLIPPDRLRRWVVEVSRLARLLADALGATGGVAERVPSRVWRLGRVQAGGRAWPAFLAVGLARSDAAGVVALVPELTSPSALVLVPTSVPPLVVWGTAGGPVVVPLTDLVTL